MSAAQHTAALVEARTHPRRAALALAKRWALAFSVLAFTVLWVGGVASAWLGRARGDDGLLASLFLLLAGLVVLLGARARKDAAALGAVALLGFAVEAVGVRTGFPFGAYAYTGVLRPQLFGVPVVMGFAWMALVAFACDLAGRLRLPPWRATVLAALWTTAVDLVIDPLAANHFGYWAWAHEGAYYGIPFTNFAGWFFTALLACRVLVAHARTNFCAGFVGTAILLFFAANALAHSLPLVATLGLALCAARVAVRFGPARN
jgi:putative membrane protein